MQVRREKLGPVDREGQPTGTKGYDRGTTPALFSDSVCPTVKQRDLLVLWDYKIKI